MRNQHGSWVWYELPTSDADAAQAFYEKVVGWTIARAEINGQPSPMDYRILTAPDGQAAGGLMQFPAGMEGPPGWLGYIGVDDVDKAVAAVEHAGGSTHMPATDMPGVGRLALLADPQGVHFYVMRGEPDEPSTAYGRMAMGHCSWNELATPDDAAALHFYGSLFGFVKDGAMPMGEMGEYSFLRHATESEVFGAVMPTQPGQPKAWLFYFRVPDIDAAIAAVKDNGGSIVTGPMEVPGGERVAVAIDPQGAAVGLVAPGQ